MLQTTFGEVNQHKSPNDAGAVTPPRLTVVAQEQALSRISVTQWEPTLERYIIPNSSALRSATFKIAPQAEFRLLRSILYILHTRCHTIPS